MIDLVLLRPWWLLATPLGVALLAWAWRRTASAGAWHGRCDPALLARLGVRRTTRRVGGAPFVAALAVTLASIALAGPSWHSREQPVYRGAGALVVVLDLSRSMDASDVPPSRLARARFKAADLLDRFRDGQSGLVVFAGDAFVVAPLTDDVATLENLLPALTTELMPVQGSRADLGLARAGDLLEGAAVRNADVILVSDGADDPRAVAAARALAEAGHRVSALAVGSEEGAPVPLPGGGFLTDASGDIVVPGLDQAGLAAIARAGRGVLAGLSADDTDLRALRAARTSGNRGSEAVRVTERREDGGPWVALVLLPLAALGFRRGWLLTVALTVALPASPARAAGLDGLWQRAEQRAARALADGAHAEAARLAPDARWRAPARYRAGEYEAAAGEFASLDGADARYNEANALARAGRLEEALAAYDAALSTEPDMDDARHNRELVEALLRQRPPDGGDGSRDPGQAGEREPDDAEASAANEGAADSGSEPGEPERGAGADGEDNAGAPADAGQAAREREPGGDADEEKRREPGAQARGAGGDASTDAAARPTAEAAQDTEAEQAMEQWLRRIPDDPGGLLRRKFALEHRRRGDRAAEGQTW